MTIMIWVAWVLVAAWAVFLGVVAWGTVLTWRYIVIKGDDVAPQGSFEFPPITVLKPLKGMEFEIRENLVSFFELQYPKFELLFNVAEANDPVIPVIQELMKLYPQVDATLTVGEVVVGHNPKINNLILSYEKGKYDWNVIIDSNIRVSKPYLKHIASKIKPDTGCITTAFVGQKPQGVGGWMERVFLNTQNTRWMIIGHFSGRPFVVGKSMMFKKSVMERVGGLRYLGTYLAEDAVTGFEVLKMGLKIVVPSITISQMLGKQSFQSYWSRHVRWGRIRKSQVTGVFMTEPFACAFGSGLLGATGVSMATGAPFWVPLLAHWVVWGFCDFFIMKKLSPSTGIKDMFFWFIQEILLLPMWLHALSSNKVMWRGNALHLKFGGKVQFTEALKRTPQELKDEAESPTTW